MSDEREPDGVKMARELDQGTGGCLVILAFCAFAGLAFFGWCAMLVSLIFDRELRYVTEAMVGTFVSLGICYLIGRHVAES